MCIVSNMTKVVDYLLNVNERREANPENQLLMNCGMEIIHIDFMPYTCETDEYLSE